MVEVKQVFEEKPFPGWIKRHKVFKEFNTITKIFPDIGLSNCEKEVEIDNSKEAYRAAKNLLANLKQQIDYKIYLLQFTTMPKIKKAKANTLLPIFRSINKSLAKAAIRSINGKHTLNLPINILDKDNKVLFKSGEGLFRVYNKLNELLQVNELRTMSKLETMGAFKEFSAKNVPTLNYKVVFSSDEIEGIWDIATMSMRGIESCQSWGRPQSKSLIGSIIDPFTGIIYLTSGSKFKDYGTKMIRRCVVRFVLGKKDEKPSIFLEDMYPDHNKKTMEQFISFIKEKVGNKFDVRSGYNGGKYFVPVSKALNSLSEGNYPYTDTDVLYLGSNNLQSEEFAYAIYDVVYECEVSLINTMAKMKSVIAKSDCKTMQNIQDGYSFPRANYRQAINYIVDELFTSTKTISGFKKMMIDASKNPEKFVLSILSHKRITKLHKFDKATLKSIAKASVTSMKKCLLRQAKWIENEYPTHKKTKKLYSKYLN